MIEEVVKESLKLGGFLTLSTRNAIDGDTLERSLKHLTESLEDYLNIKS